MTEGAHDGTIGSLGGYVAFAEQILSSGETVSLEPGTIERLIAACDVLADAMGDLADRARKELRADDFGLGDAHPSLISAQQLARKFNEKAVGGSGIDDANTAVGLFKAHQAYAVEVRAMLVQVLAAYTAQEQANTDALNAVGPDH